MMDNDFVITTDELAEWIKEEKIDFDSLEISQYDSVLGKGSGGGLIFGNSGGVMEAAIRTVYKAVTGKPAIDNLLDFKPVRGLKNFKEASITLNGLNINVAVIFGTATAERLIQEGFEKYHFIEVMTCPGGCISGAGQPRGNVIPVTNHIRQNRIKSLYDADKKMKVRNSIDNPEIEQIYNEFYSKPLSEIAKKLLHTSYSKK